MAFPRVLSFKKLLLAFELASMAVISLPQGAGARSVVEWDDDLGGETVLMTPGESRVQRDQQNLLLENRYIYSTSDDIVLNGILAPTVARNGEKVLDLAPQEIAVPAGTKFEILDRIIDPSGLRLVQLAIDTGRSNGERMEIWILESELSKALSGQTDLGMNLEQLNPSTAKFYYMGEYSVAGPFQLVMPVRGARRTSPPGMRIHPILRYRKFHAGWDLAAPSGTPVMAAAAGVVLSAGWGGGYGNLIILQHGVLQTRYAHLSRILVRRGQRVGAGQVIGRVGSTGRSTGPHLHFEKRIGGRVLTGPLTSPSY